MRAALVVLAVAITGCSSSNDGGSHATPPADDDNLATGSLMMALDQSAITVAPGATQTVAVQLTRLGAVADATVNLFVTAPPAGITVDLPASTTDDTAVLTLTAAADATATVANVAIAAESEGYGASATLALTVGAPTPIAVSGRYLSGAFILDGANIALYSAGATTAQTTTTAADGTFSFSNVTPPYDLVFTWPDDDSGNDAYIVEGPHA